MREATSNDKKRIIDIISTSFDKNKSINYVVKQDKKRGQRIRSLIEYSFFYGMEFGKVFISNDDKATCIIIHSNKKRGTLKSILWDLKLVIKCIGIKRVPAVMKRENLVKKNHPKEDFIHLWYIGVDPKYQNQGIGSDLLKEVLKEYSSKPYYLETSTLSNLPFYKKFGFNVINKIDLGYQLFIMKKESYV
ncbi:GNAT family N-acetyltransferase [Aquimarina longa]|uniref:GNAT family N-acetyltransferase n=1 Tax=Aquimarina longa TaxID=1080221 RepID=UPI0007806238|nr:GNAT family N-acetyltransferase [Aquimarina longa]